MPREFEQVKYHLLSSPFALLKLLFLFFCFRDIHYPSFFAEVSSAISLCSDLIDGRTAHYAKVFVSLSVPTPLPDKGWVIYRSDF